jgi:flagellar export protein FliJ
MTSAGSAFKFRAAAALELRRREEDAAAGVLAAAEAALVSARARAEQAEHDRHHAQAEQQAAERRGINGGSHSWYRNWVTRLGAAVDQAHQEARRRAEAARVAEAAWYEARRKRLALERMRDRALSRFRAEERRAEMKVIDELARLRFVLGDGSNF